MDLPAKVARQRSRAPSESLLPEYLQLWKLESDGERIVTPSSLLLPVRTRWGRAMLKVLHPGSDEIVAHVPLKIWQGDGAVRLLQSDGRALLLERLAYPAKLTDLALSGEDDRASRIIAKIAYRLHAPRRRGLVRMRTRMRPLRNFPDPSKQPLIDMVLLDYLHQAVAFEDVTVLHGDLHHSNIMLSSRGYLAIDPKGLVGDKTYDLANVLLNPYPHRHLVMNPDRMLRQARNICGELRLDVERLLAWTMLHGLLAATWAAADAEAESWWLEGASIAGRLLESEFHWSVDPRRPFRPSSAAPA